MADRVPMLVMGVVNVTPDSFSDGGKWFDPDAAITHGLDLVADGAHDQRWHALSHVRRLRSAR